jgi:hypothetical protein
VDGQTRVDILGNPLTGSTAVEGVEDSGAPPIDYYSKMFINHYQFRYAERVIYKKYKGYANYSDAHNKYTSGVIGIGDAKMLARYDRQDHNCTLLQMPTRYMNKEPKI